MATCLGLPFCSVMSAFPPAGHDDHEAAHQHQLLLQRRQNPQNRVPLAAAPPITSRLKSPSPVSLSPGSANEDSSNNGSARRKRLPSGTPDDGTSKPKQKRNKPTLSCEECVERKTKVSALKVHARDTADGNGSVIEVDQPVLLA